MEGCRGGMPGRNGKEDVKSLYIHSSGLLEYKLIFNSRHCDGQQQLAIR